MPKRSEEKVARRVSGGGYLSTGNRAKFVGPESVFLATSFSLKFSQVFLRYLRGFGWQQSADWL